MAIKLLILAACGIPVDDGFVQHADINDTVTVPDEDAHALARMGRAYYVDRDADPTKGALTATDADKQRLKAHAKAIVAQHEAAAVAAKLNSPAGLAEAIAAAVAAGVAGAVGKQKAAADPAALA